MKKREDLKILLLQIREDVNVKAEELQSFADYAGLETNQIQTHDVFKTPNFDKSILNGFDALFVGGASEASVLEPDKYTFVESIKNLMNDTIEMNFPVFASCFGFQAAILAFGGEIIRDKENFEMGTYPMTLTGETELDPVFNNIPNHFMGISVHQEKAIKVPSHCELLAYTQDCMHAFRYEHKNFWAFQFHPELDKPRLTERLNAYKEKYTEDIAHFNKVISTLEETPHANQLVGNFTKYLLTIIK